MNLRPKTPQELESMRQSGKRLNTVLEQTYEFLAEGKSLKEIDQFADRAIREQGGAPSFLGYHDYPASSCLSVNDVVVHGIPTDYKLKRGDVISVDIGMYYDGYHTDAAFTTTIGEPTDAQRDLIEHSQQSLEEGIQVAVSGNTVADIGIAIEAYLKSKGSYGIIRDLTGHGIGKNLQESPEIPNYATHSHTQLINGITLAIEPMVSLGTWKVAVDNIDDWTIRTTDKSSAAHFETTIIINDNDPEILVPFPLKRGVFC